MHDQAIESYNEAIKIKSNYAEAYFSKGNSLREINLLEEAIVEYKNAFKINTQLKIYLGLLFLQNITYVIGKIIIKM